MNEKHFIYNIAYVSEGRTKVFKLQSNQWLWDHDILDIHGKLLVQVPSIQSVILSDDVFNVVSPGGHCLHDNCATESW